jgi:hypothetical protein
MRREVHMKHVWNQKRLAMAAGLLAWAAQGMASLF